MTAHNLIKDALHAGSNKAGLNHPNEPTHTALLARLQPGDMAKLFPKHPSEANVGRSKELITNMLTIDGMALGPARTAAEGEMARDLAAIAAPNKGLRLDVYISDPSPVDQVPGLLVDVATMHPFAGRQASKEAAVAKARAQAIELEPHKPLHGRLRSSPGLEEAFQRKQRRYAPLMHAIGEQIRLGQRADRRPYMTPLIVSTMGQVMGFGAIQNSLEVAYTRRLRAQPPRDDGKEIPYLVAVFIKDVRSRIVAAAQRGLARSMVVAGRLWTPKPGGSRPEAPGAA
jgi:hypothetical protein